jgi:hypothetical protein
MIKDDKTYCIPCYTIMGGGVSMTVKCTSCGTDVTKRPYVGKGGKVYCVPCYQAVGGDVNAIQVRVPSYVQSLKNPISKRALKAVKESAKLHPYFGQVRQEWLKPEELAMRQQLGPMEQNPKSAEQIVKEIDILCAKIEIDIDRAKDISHTPMGRRNCADMAQANIGKAKMLYSVLLPEDKQHGSDAYELGDSIYEYEKEIFEIQGKIPILFEQNPHSPGFNKYMAERHTEQAVGDIRDGIITKKEWIKQLMSDYRLPKDEAEKLTESKMKSCEENPIRDQVPGAEYKSFMTTTEDVKAMLKPLEEFKTLKIEKDFTDAKTVRVITPKGYVIFWAIGKGGDVWIVRHMVSLFSGVRDEQNPNKITWKCPHCGSMGLRPWKTEFKEPGHKIIYSICEDCGKESVQEITPVGVEQNPMTAGEYFPSMYCQVCGNSKKGHDAHIADGENKPHEFTPGFKTEQNPKSYLKLYEDISGYIYNAKGFIESGDLDKAHIYFRIAQGLRSTFTKKDDKEFEGSQGYDDYVWVRKVLHERAPQFFPKWENEENPLKCPKCGWIGSIDDTREHMGGEPVRICPNCGSDIIPFKHQVEQNPQPTIWYAGSELKFKRTYDETKDIDWDKDAQETINYYRRKGGEAAVIHSGNLHHLYAVDKVESNPWPETGAHDTGLDESTYWFWVDPTGYPNVRYSTVSEARKGGYHGPFVARDGAEEHRISMMGKKTEQNTCLVTEQNPSEARILGVMTDYLFTNKYQFFGEMDESDLLNNFDELIKELIQEYPELWKKALKEFKDESANEQNPVDYYTIERELVELINQSKSSYDAGNKVRAKSMIDRAWGLWSALVVSEQVKFEKEHPGPFKYMFEFKISGQKGEGNPNSLHPDKYGTELQKEALMWATKLGLGSKAIGTTQKDMWYFISGCESQVKSESNSRVGKKHRYSKEMIREGQSLVSGLSEVGLIDYLVHFRQSGNIQGENIVKREMIKRGFRIPEKLTGYHGSAEWVQKHRNPRVGKKRRKELLKKIPMIKQGYGTRPPKEWWEGMSKIVKKGYSGRSKQSQARIAAGIWHKYPAEAKIGIIRRLAGGVGGVPAEMNPQSTKEIVENINSSIELAEGDINRGRKKSARDEFMKALGLYYNALTPEEQKVYSGLIQDIIRLERKLGLSEMNPYTSTGLYYPTKGTKEAKIKMSQLRKMRKGKRYQENIAPIIVAAAAPIVAKEAPKVISKIKKASGEAMRRLKGGKEMEFEENPLASADVLAELARRRQSELIPQFVAEPIRRTVYWIAGGDDQNTELRKKILKENLEKRYGCKIEVVKSPGQKIWGRQGRRPSGWEFVAVQ